MRQVWTPLIALGALASSAGKITTGENGYHVDPKTKTKTKPTLRPCDEKLDATGVWRM